MGCSSLPSASQSSQSISLVAHRMMGMRRVPAWDFGSRLLLLGLSNRYSTIINRIRLLNDEKRREHGEEQEENCGEGEKAQKIQFQPPLAVKQRRLQPEVP
jgi:hypothetical protein